MHILELGCHNQPTEISPGEDSDLPYFFFFLGSEVFCSQGGICRDQRSVPLHLGHTANES